MRIRFWANVGLCVLLGLGVVFGISRFSSALTPKGLLVSEPEPSPEAAALMDKVRLLDYNLSEQPGHMVRADFVVRNTSDRDVKNIEVLCEFFDGQHNYVDRKLWLLSGRVPAGKTMQHQSVSKRYINSRTAALQCRLTDFALVSEPAFVLHREEGGHEGEAAGHDRQTHDKRHGHH